MDKLTLNYDADSMLVPAKEIPSWVSFFARQHGVEKNFLISAWGGLGDIICAEPAIRFALKRARETNSGIKFHIQTQFPELFSHLEFDGPTIGPELSNQKPEVFHIFHTIKPPSNLLWHFMSHMLVNAVDFSSICLFRQALPVSEKEIRLPDFNVSKDSLVAQALSDKENTVVLHPGLHWPSKTFPLEWWNQLIEEFHKANFKIALIGKWVEKDLGYLPVNAEGCIDLRDKTSIREWVWLLKNCTYLFTNDSSPIHAAASGKAFIGFVATPKHPDYIMHWRDGIFGKGMKNFGHDGPWNYEHFLPIYEEKKEIEFLPDGMMEKILPNPKEVVDFYKVLRWNGGHPVQPSMLTG